jgi:hypothetical protein
MTFLVILLALYFVPTVIAVLRQHKQALPIFILDLFLGWTLVGWVGALVWSLTTPAAPVVIYRDAGQ